MNGKRRMPVKARGEFSAAADDAASRKEWGKEDEKENAYSVASVGGNVPDRLRFFG